MRILIVTLAASLSLVSGCGGNGAIEGGDFEPEPGCSSNAECADQPSPTKCFEFGAEGPSTCGYLHVPETECRFEDPRDQCCSTDDCDGGRCFLVSRLTSPCGVSGGGDGRNECIVDECESDADCQGGLCTPDGYTEGRACLPAACASDADCAEKEDGVCLFLDLGCCGVGSGVNRLPEIACAYPGDGCQSDADCPDSEYCVVRDGRAVCSVSCP